MTAVGLAVPVERGEQQGPALERSQDAARALRSARRRRPERSGARAPTFAGGTSAAPASVAERNSERMYSARNRSSPPEALVDRRLRPRARRGGFPPPSPRISRAARSLVRREPRVEARRSASPSRRLSASSPACSSSSLPSARRRAIGSPGVRRPTSVSVDPAGTCSASVASAFVALRERRQLRVVDHEHEVLARAQPRGEPRSSSVHSFRRRTAGLSARPISSRIRAPGQLFEQAATSSSASSTVSQATGRRSRSAHCAASVVFPYPAGAVSVTSDAEAVRRRFTSGVRDTAQGGGDGTRTFASTTFDGSARVRPELERGMPGSMRGRPSRYQSGRTTLAVGPAPVPTFVPPRRLDASAD